MPKIKTFKQWDKSGLELTEFLNPCDQVDEEIFLHMATVVNPQYDSGDLLQVGEADFEEAGVYFYSTFRRDREKDQFFYLGILPEFLLPKN